MKSKLRTRSAKRKLLFCLCLCLAAHAIVLSLPRRRAATRGLFPVSKEGKWGFIDGGGRVRIPPRFDSAASFSEGLARVTEGGRPAFINAAGEVVFRPQFDTVGDFSEGLAFAEVGWKTHPSIGITMEMGKWGYVDKTGRLAVPPHFDDAGDFYEGLAAVRLSVDESRYVTCQMPEPGSTSTSTKLYGYVDESGRLRIPPRFEYAGPFSEGLANVSNCSKPVFIDKTGAAVLRVPFEEASPFRGGLAPVLRFEPGGARAGYIDKTGKVVWGPSR